MCSLLRRGAVGPLSTSQRLRARSVARAGHALRTLATLATPEYPPPFTSPPFSPPPPPPPFARPNPSPSSRPVSRRSLLLAGLVATLGLGYLWWRHTNHGFPLSSMARIEHAQRLLAQAEALDSASPPSPSPQRDGLLQQAEALLREALALTHTPDPLHSSTTTPLLSYLPTYIDPALPPHILALLGRASVLLGPSHYKGAEAYFLAALRLLVAEGRRQEEGQGKVGGKEGGGKGQQEGMGGTKEYFDGQTLSVGRQLGWLFYLMDNDVAAEAVLQRCLQLLAELRESQQAKAARVNMEAAGQVGEGLRGWVSPSEYSDDVTAELSEQLSGVYRKRGDFHSAVQWASNALKMNEQADKAAQAGEGGKAAASDDAALQRRLRAVHLYTALTSDLFALHLAPASKSTPLLSTDSAPSPLDDAYHASMHALEQLQQLIDAVDAQPSSAASSSKRKSKPASSAPSFTTTSRSPAPPPPPLRSAPLEVLPSTSHVDFLSSPRVLRVLSRQPSAELSGVLVEVVACYANLASVLSAGGKEEDADRAWEVATKAADLSGDPALLNIIREQQEMLRPTDSD